jgi:hypothetical protein
MRRSSLKPQWRDLIVSIVTALAAWAAHWLGGRA